jgi:transcriptional regulator with XRE-family HTH domain
MAARLRQVRATLGIPAQVVCAALNIDPAQLSRHETGARGIGSETIAKYAEYYGVDYDFLVGKAVMSSAPNDTSWTLQDTPGKRLKALRRSRGYPSPTNAARALGMSTVTMNQHERDLRSITTMAAERYAAFYRVSPAHILFGAPLPTQTSVPIVGYLGVGGTVIDMTPNGTELREIPAPVGQNVDLVAYRVIGDHLYPVLHDGDVVLAEKPNGAPIDANRINNRECIVTAATGEKQIRVVRAESNGRYSVFGYHMPPQFNVKLVEACVVVQINRGQLRGVAANGRV